MLTQTKDGVIDTWDYQWTSPVWSTATSRPCQTVIWLAMWVLVRMGRTPRLRLSPPRYIMDWECSIIPVFCCATQRPITTASIITSVELLRTALTICCNAEGALAPSLEPVAACILMIDSNPRSIMCMECPCDDRPHFQFFLSSFPKSYPMPKYRSRRDIVCREPFGTFRHLPPRCFRLWSLFA